MTVSHKYYMHLLFLMIIASNSIHTMDTPSEQTPVSSPITSLRHPAFSQLSTENQYRLYLGITNLSHLVTQYIQNPSDDTARKTYRKSVSKAIAALKESNQGTIDESSIIHNNLVLPFTQFNRTKKRQLLLEQLHKDLNDVQKEQFLEITKNIFLLYTNIHCVSERGTERINQTQNPGTDISTSLTKNPSLNPRVELLNDTFFCKTGPFYSMIKECISESNKPAKPFMIKENMSTDKSIKTLLDLVWSYDSNANYNAKLVTDCFVIIKNSLGKLSSQNTSDLVALGMLRDTKELVIQTYHNLTDENDIRELRTAYDDIAKEFFIP
jgi:hypothetical protein